MSDAEIMKYDGDALAIVRWANSNKVVVGGGGNGVYIFTPEGGRRLRVGEWLAKDINGTVYPLRVVSSARDIPEK